MTMTPESNYIDCAEIQILQRSQEKYNFVDNIILGVAQTLEIDNKGHLETVYILHLRHLYHFYNSQEICTLGWLAGLLVGWLMGCWPASQPDNQLARQPGFQPTRRPDLVTNIQIIQISQMPNVSFSHVFFLLLICKVCIFR